MKNPFKSKPTIQSAINMFTQAIADLNAVALENRDAAVATEAEAEKLDAAARSFHKTADEALRLSGKLSEVVS